MRLFLSFILIFASLSILTHAQEAQLANAVSSTQTFNSVLKVAPADETVIKNSIYAGCKIFKKPDGRTFTAAGRTLAAGGECPSTFVKAEITGSNELHISRHDARVETGERLCYLNEQGGCSAFRFLDNPRIPSTTIISAVNDFHSDSPVDAPSANLNNHVLRVDKARGTIRLQEGDWSTCQVFRVPDGTNFTSNGKAVAAGGKCPLDAFIPGKLIGTDQIQIFDHICKLNGVGTCIGVRYVSSSLPQFMPAEGWDPQSNVSSGVIQ